MTNGGTGTTNATYSGINSAIDDSGAAAIDHHFSAVFRVSSDCDACIAGGWNLPVQHRDMVAGKRLTSLCCWRWAGRRFEHGGCKSQRYRSPVFARALPSVGSVNSACVSTRQLMLLACLWGAVRLGGSLALPRGNFARVENGVRPNPGTTEHQLGNSAARQHASAYGNGSPVGGGGDAVDDTG